MGDPTRKYTELAPGLVVEVEGGPFEGYEGTITEWNFRHAKLEVAGLFGRTVTVQVPTETICRVPSIHLSEAERLRRLQEDPYASLIRAIWEMIDLGCDHFDCADPNAWDMQVHRNWLWFHGTIDPRAMDSAGVYVKYRVNCNIAYLPMLLVTRDSLSRINHVEPENTVGASSFLSGRDRLMDWLKPGTCYRGTIYRPSRIAEAAQSPLEDRALRRFARGHYVATSIQFQPVPELGIFEDYRRKDQPGYTTDPKNRVARAACFALPLIQHDLARHLRMTRWGVLSSRFHRYGTEVLPEEQHNGV